jgi:hypothetical protein
MIFLLRIAVIFISGYFLYMVYLWWQENYSPSVTCPQCDGEGKWDVIDIEEECILCKGKGKIERQL